MIISKLIGGLGNQMFQYAAGRRAAFVNKTFLKLDISGYKNQAGMTKRKYFLSCFNINEEFASISEINKFKGKDNQLQKILRKIYPFVDNKTYVIEKHFHFSPNILKTSDNTYLEGYWASEKYFKDIENVIRQDFTFKFKPDLENKKLIEKIKNSMSISIHVRRGDYVSVKKTYECHGICSLEYYKKAINLIIAQVKEPHFFIFSDEPEWIKQNLKLKYPNTNIDYNFQKQDYEDLRLISLCKHNIVANSSFSWWGAWLNQNPNKIVIAPKKWFRDKSIDTKDLIPRSWVKI